MDPLIDLALLLFGAKLGGTLFSKLKQPSVAGEMLAGLVLGPSLLALIKLSSLVTVVRDLGLLFLVLVVSLGVDWKSIEGHAEKYAWVEVTRVAITLSIICIAGMMLSWDLYTTMIIGFIIVLSSTAIVSRTLADIKELNSIEGRHLMGLEIVDEVAAVIVVAIIANVIKGASVTFEPVLTTILVVIGLFVVMSRIGFRIVNRITGFIQKYGMEDALLGFTLLLAFILGSITESLNLASILGVFLAGMILCRSVQHPIITRKVKEVGESFFIPVFFASVGLTINIFVVMQHAWIIALLICAIVGIKLASSMIALRLFSYTSDQSLKISSGFVTLSEMTIVIAALAISKLDPVIYISILASFLIINMVSPVLMSIVFSKRRWPSHRM